MLTPFFKSIIDQDTSAIVICDTAHRIIYMNPCACERYRKYGGSALLGKNLLLCHNEHSRAAICRVLDWFAAAQTHNRVHSYYSEKEQKDVYIIALRDEDGQLIGYYEKHEYRTPDPTPLYQLH